MKKQIQLITRQKGIALVISLVMLTILTLLGVSNMSSSTINIKMAANSQAERNSFQAAYSAGNRILNDDSIDYTNPNTVQSRSAVYGSSATGFSNVAITISPLGITEGSTKEGESLSGVAGRFLKLQIK